MIETSRNGGMLAPWTYTSEELCELEIDHIFRHQWILAGHISELTQTGDYLTFNLSKERAVLVRDESGEIHAFHNVCRHRGSRVVPDQQGNCGHVLRCPFHGWTYQLNGALKSVPRSQSFLDLKKDRNALVPIDLEVWNGFIFICFEGAQGQSVATQLGVINEKIIPYKLEEMVPWGVEYDEVADYNWKFFHDVDNEGYHVPVAHPALHQLYGRDYNDSYVGNIPISTGVVDDYPASSWSVARYKSLLPRQAHLPDEYQRLWLYFGLFPNTVIYFYPEKAGFYMSLPQGATVTRVISREYRLPGEGRELAAARYLSGRIDQITGREDHDLVRGLQEAVHTSVFPLNNLSDLEDGVVQFHHQLKTLVPVMSLEDPPAPGTLADINTTLLNSSS